MGNHGMMIPKKTALESKALRDSAKGEECTLQITFVCHGNPATTVLCHLPDESHGMGKKSDDISAAFGCSACHDVIDGRVPTPPLVKADMDFYMRRAQTRTLRRWIEMGLVKIKGMT
ncbi:MAG: DUF1364 domain-containing protein [Candidatus Anammoxibacter sp.]